MTTNNRFHSNDVQINEDLDFSSLVSNPALLQGLVQAGYQRPSPIQLKTIPLGRLGLDLIAQAKSGTGKTIVFSVIAIESVLSSKDTSESSSPNQHQQPRAVILAPTREIAVQIQEVIQSVLHNGLERKVLCHSMIGGMPIQQDKANLQNCSIVVGTPGRIRSLISTGHLKPNQIRLLVLDEADKLMEDAFKDDVVKIAQGLGSPKQVMAFSATYDDDLLSQLDQLVKDPVYIMLSNGTPELEAVLQFYKVVIVPEAEKSESMFMRQNQLVQRKFVELDSLLAHVPFYQAIVFINHRGRAGDLVKFLNRQGYPAMHITARISQQERLDVMAKARKFEIRVLVCSDLIARGIDIDRVNLVVNLDLPKDPETYLHRIGRTGRFGTTGLAVSLVDEVELKTVEILKGEFSITMQELPSDDGEYKELIKKSNSRHHERPLQAKDDQEKYQKLETTASKIDRSIQPVCEVRGSTSKPDQVETQVSKKKKKGASEPLVGPPAKKRKVVDQQKKPSRRSTTDDNHDTEGHVAAEFAEAETEAPNPEHPYPTNSHSFHPFAFNPYAQPQDAYAPYPMYHHYYPVPYYHPGPAPSSIPVFFPPDLPLFPPKSHFWEYFK
ncbi:DEAD (Asp-Glu-Ala-Asp) box polypeptide 20 [Podila epicladia]|nr:DEAD (Asp-Glu-Ala-Asp) box polypeptide 20 [Podila epicladia]KAG0096454.1 DEAD (Asp-Glu-Ala-Asp) box polypeptide 20 [Podila epicladia]